MSGAAGTYEAYERVMRLHVVPHLGGRTIAQVTASDVEELYALWRRGCAALNTVRPGASRCWGCSRTPSGTSGYRATVSRKSRSSAIRPFWWTSEHFRALKRSQHWVGNRATLGADCLAHGMRRASNRRISRGFRVVSSDALRARRQVVRVKNTSGGYLASAPLKHRPEGEWRDIPAPDFLERFKDNRLRVLYERGRISHSGLVRKSWDRTIERLDLPKYTPHGLRGIYGSQSRCPTVPLCTRSPAEWDTARSTRRRPATATSR